MVNREKLVNAVRYMRHFIDRSLGLSYETHTFTGFELSESIIDAAAYNT